MVMVMAVASLLAGCGSDEPKPKLIFADLNWSSALVQNEIARTILGTGYGYETDAVSGGTIPLMQALTKGDVNVNLEIWMPNQAAAYGEAKAAGVTTEIGKSITTGAWQSTFIIPKYTADANPWLKKASDLKDPRATELFKSPMSKGKVGIITCIPGWECEKVNEKQVYAYGLKDAVELINPGSYAALNAEILGSYEKKQDVVHYYWGPEALPGKLTAEHGGYVMLEEPAYTKACWDEIAAADKADDMVGKDGCGYPLADVLIVVNKSQITEENAPEVYELFKQFAWTGGEIEVMLSHMADNGLDAAETAKWVMTNSAFDKWKSWVDKDALKKIEEVL
jgi:glycine betaine/proline transport system substrate-binding protein